MSSQIAFSTVDEIKSGFGDWLATTGNRGHGRSERSISSHLSDLNVFERFLLDSTGLPMIPKNISSYDIRAFHAWSIKEQQVEAATWNRRRTSISLFCEWAIETKQITDSPFKGIPYQQGAEKAPRWPDKSDYSRFMRTVELSINAAKTATQRKLAIRDQAMVILMACSGMRESDVAELTASDLLLSERKGEARIRDGKGHKSRIIPLGRESRIALTAWLQTEPFGLQDQIFSVSTRQIQRQVKDICCRAGVNITPHQLRHHLLHKMLKSGATIAEVQEIAGHSNPKTTMRYTTPSFEELAEAVENL